MHERLILNTWFVWFSYIASVVVLLGAVAVLWSALRRPQSDFGRFGRAPWIGLQAAFLVVSTFGIVAQVFGYAGALPAGFFLAGGMLVLVVIIQQIAYLLRVVFPSPNRRAALAAPAHSDTEELSSDA